MTGRSTALWDDLLAAGGRVDLHYSRPMMLAWAAVCLVPVLLGVAVIASGDVVPGLGGVVIFGLGGGWLVWEAFVGRTVVTITDDAISFRERRRLRTVRWASVRGAVVFRPLALMPQVLLQLKSTTPGGPERRALLPGQLEVNARELRSWIDRRVGWPVRR